MKCSGRFAVKCGGCPRWRQKNNYSLLSLIFRGGVFQQSLNIIETINITETGDLGDPQLFTSNSTPNNVQNWPKRGRKGNPQIRGVVAKKSKYNRDYKYTILNINETRL